MDHDTIEFSFKLSGGIHDLLVFKFVIFEHFSVNVRLKVWQLLLILRAVLGFINIVCGVVGLWRLALGAEVLLLLV